MIVLEEAKPERTYLDGYFRVWIGYKYDLALTVWKTGATQWSIYRKGNYMVYVNGLPTALAIIADRGRGTVEMIDHSGPDWPT